MKSSPNERPRTRRWTVLALTVWAVISAGSVVLLAQAHGRAKASIDQQFQLRATIASRFVTTYVHDLTRRQSAQAIRHLSSPAVSDSQFETAAEDSGFSAALLLDHDGRIVQSMPADPTLIGKDLTANYAHLRAGVAGHVAVGVVAVQDAERDRW